MINTLVRRSLLVLAACWLFVGYGAPQALAHDRLKSSSPARNAAVAAVEEIELEFTSRVRLPAVVLHDEGGTAVSVEKPEVDGAVVTVRVPQPPAPGRYVIGWRVVSSDGHPIEGEIPFTVKGAASTTPTPSVSESATVASAAPEPSAAPATAAGADKPAEQGVPVWLWATGAVVALAGAALLLVRRGRKEPGEDEVMREPPKP
ncbi:copper resistance protein CopC [Nonomuraea sp. NPDC059194]|uniref:copper resistance CopC family protein n=1 Tax=Nonomuraea sp. NPDC059194 TaxID=3346764 RepID=UPI0036CBC67A